MCKYVYTDTNKPTGYYFLPDFEVKGVRMNLKSYKPDGRIIADDNKLEGL